MRPLAELVTERQTLSSDAFLQRHPNPVLVLVVGDDAEEKWRAFRTTLVTSQALARVRTDLPALLAAYTIVEVTKSTDSPWRHRISLGRARNNDKLIKDRSISKLHAQFTFNEEGEVRLGDCGSRNGTRVNGRRLAPEESLALAAGDEIRIGRIDAVYYTPGAFFDFLGTVLGL